MATFSIDDVLEEDDAVDNALAALGNYINDVLAGSHELIMANENNTVPTDPYVTLRILTGSGAITSNLGNKPIYHDIDDVGTETYVYQDQLRIQLKAYKTDAFKVMKKLRKYLTNDKKHYLYFGSDPTVGITNIGQVVDAPTLVDDQSMEAGATMTLSLNYVHKVVDTDSDYITTVNYTANTTNEQGDVLTTTSSSVTNV